jgi:hypothetical protein
MHDSSVEKRDRLTYDNPHVVKPFRAVTGKKLMMKKRTEKPAHLVLTRRGGRRPRRPIFHSQA